MKKAKKMRGALFFFLLAVLMNFSYTLRAHSPAGFLTGDVDLKWWNHTVFYEVFVRSFSDSRSGSCAADGIGDLKGLIERLDYLNDGKPDTFDDLGITGIWLMPVMQSPSYHGYDITDFYTIENDYGTNKDFKKLIEEAHKRGIRVIIDLVLNHISKEHPWFKNGVAANSTYHNWFIWAEKEPGFKGPWGQKVWHSAGDLFYYGIFWEGMPDLNYRNPDVTKEMYSVARFWLNEMGVDGFRLDAIRHLFEEADVQVDVKETHNWLRNFFTFYKGIAPQAMSVGEIWADTETIARYNTGDQLDLVFHFDFAEAILKSVKSGSSDAIASLQLVTKMKFPRYRYATFITNHDQNRVLNQLGGDIEKAKLAAAILLTSPGVPFIYYGEEIGMTGQKPDPKIRTPMQWTPGLYSGFSKHQPWQAVNDGFENVNVHNQKSDSKFLFCLYRKLIHLRNKHIALQAGDYIKITSSHKQVYAFLRISSTEAIMVLFNLGAKPIKDYSLAFELPQEYRNIKMEELLQGIEVAPLKLQKDGRIAQYKPFEKLEPLAGYIIRLHPMH
jgi:glycosidase